MPEQVRCSRLSLLTDLVHRPKYSYNISFLVVSLLGKTLYRHHNPLFTFKLSQQTSLIKSHSFIPIVIFFYTVFHPHPFQLNLGGSGVSSPDKRTSSINVSFNLSPKSINSLWDVCPRDPQHLSIAQYFASVKPQLSRFFQDLLSSADIKDQTSKIVSWHWTHVFLVFLLTVFACITLLFTSLLLLRRLWLYSLASRVQSPLILFISYFNSQFITGIITQLPQCIIVILSLSFFLIIVILSLLMLKLEFLNIATIKHFN